MLLHCIRLPVSMFIVLALCQELACFKPLRLSPRDEEIELKEGETLSILCYSFTLLKFVYPDCFGNSINTSYYRIYHEMENDVYYHTFNRPNTIFGDTGWYGCADHNFHSSTKSSDAEVDWLYVYVKSNTNLFVKTDNNVHLSATAGGSIVIPCRTTLPDLKPILINGNEDELNEVSFDPKIGFTIRNLSLENSNSYKCSIEKDGEEHAVSYVLSVLKQALPEPKIQANDLFIIRGQDLNINCTVEMNLSMDCEFDWNTPQKKNSRRNNEQSIEYLDGNIALVKSTLTILNVMDEDAGDYECIVKSIYDIKKIRKNIKIHDPRTKLIKFFPVFNTSYSVERGSFVTWKVYVNTLVEPYLQWFKPDDNEIYIIGNNKNIFIREEYDSNLAIIKSFEMYSILQIKSVSEADSGNYVLQAKKDYIIERMDFTLNVIGKPILKLTHFRSYYMFNESTAFRCEVISNPPPHITWTYLKYPYYPLSMDSTIVNLMNVTQSAAYNSSYKFESIVKMSIEISGKIRCQACNKVGCNDELEDIIITEPLYLVRTNMNKTNTRIVDIVTEGRNTVILQCFADGLPNPTVTWYKDNILLKENNQYFFKYNNQELHIRYLMLQDSGKYLCRANNSMGMNETYQQITVKNTKWNTLDILVTSIPILSFILIILSFYIAIKIHHGKKIKKELMEAGLINFEEGALECLNPNLRVDDQAELLPYDKKWEFPRDRLKLKEQLDSGHFGVVMKAEAIGICKNENVTTVAVKMVRRTTNPIHIRALVSELKIMVHLGKHLNVVNLLGACTKNISKCEMLVIVKYCHFGNLRNYLLKRRNRFINQIDSKTGKFDFTIRTDVLTRSVNVNNDSLNARKCSDTDIPVVHYCPRINPSPEINFLSECVLNSNSCQPEERSNYYDDYKDQNLKPICTQDLLSWAFQVARGMEYLSQRKVLHGDLAARNVLLTEDNVVKICDFGLAKNIYKDGNYKKKSDVPVPVKWMAIESIRDRIFSTQSDVWSFGIMLWEFFTLAETPYSGMEVEKQYQKLIEGYRLEQPEYTIDKIYDIMLQCWITEPTLRPSFTDLVESIGNLLEESVKMHYIVLNNPYMDINMVKMKNGKSDYLMMMSAPDHLVPSYLDNNCINAPLPKDTSSLSYLVSEHAAELFPTLKYEEDPYLKPINVQERRAKFSRKRQTLKNQITDKSIHQNSVYCNAPWNSLEVEQHERE